MRVFPFGGQLAALSHAEAVLFVRNDQSQILKLGGVRQQGMGAHRHLDLPGSDPLPDDAFLLGRHGPRQQGHGDPQGFKQFIEGIKMLLRQNFRGRHQGALFSVPGGAVRRGSRHHGLAAAHVALNQPVHRRALSEIRQDLLHRPLLGAGEGKGQRGIERLHIEAFIRRRLFLRPCRPHKGQSRGENKEFFKDQPFFRHLGLCHIRRLVDGVIGPLGRQDAVLLPDLRRQNLRRRVADGQSLPHGFQHGRIAQPRRQGINGQHPPGGHALGVRRFKYRIGHVIPDKVSADRAVKYVFPAVLQLFRRKPVIKEGNIQPPGMVGDLHSGNIQPLADVGGFGGIHDHGLKAGGGIHLQLFDGHQFGAVFVSPGEMADQVPEGKDVQVGELLGLGRANAFQYGYRIRQLRQNTHLRTIFPYYNQNRA